MNHYFLESVRLSFVNNFLFLFHFIFLFFIFYSALFWSIICIRNLFIFIFLNFFFIFSCLFSGVHFLNDFFFLSYLSRFLLVSPNIAIFNKLVAFLLLHMLSNYFLFHPLLVNFLNLKEIFCDNETKRKRKHNLESLTDWIAASSFGERKFYLPLLLHKRQRHCNGFTLGRQSRISGTLVNMGWEWNFFLKYISLTHGNVGNGISTPFISFRLLQ